MFILYYCSILDSSVYFDSMYTVCSIKKKKKGIML